MILVLGNLQKATFFKPQQYTQADAAPTEDEYVEAKTQFAWKYDLPSYSEIVAKVDDVNALSLNSFLAEIRKIAVRGDIYNFGDISLVSLGEAILVIIMRINLMLALNHE